MKQSDAIQIIVKAFKGKTDRGGDQYVNHLFRVAATVSKSGNERLVIPALLHDLLEDCPEWDPEKLLAAGLSKEDLYLVILLTRHKGLTYEGYINAISTNKDATIIKLADLRDNMDITRLTRLSQKDFERLQKYHMSYQFLKSKLNA